MTRPTTITIDGPAGSGKSTAAKAVAARLGFTYLDTGAMYRGVAWQADKLGLGPEDTEGVEAMLSDLDLRLEPGESGARIWVNGTEATGEIRTPRISQLSSALSALPTVRAWLLDRQRIFGREQSIVAEGRDTGTVVFPEAPCKIYLDADVEERARRRLKDLRAGGSEMTIEEIITEVRTRDERDMSREHAPLKAAPDAHRIDSTALGIEDVVDRIVALAKSAEEHTTS